MTPLISVITATHNRPRFIRKAIELFAAQTWTAKEMVIVDDGDPGAVPSALPGDVCVVRIPSYTWVTHKHRLAFEVCRGEFVGYWDDDDYFSKDRLALQARHLQDGKADVCGFHVKLIVSAPDPRFWKWKRSTLDRWAANERPGFEEGLPFHDGTAVWRRELLQGVDEKALQGSQLDLMRTLRARGARLGEIPNDGVFAYVRHSNVGWDFDVRDLCEPVDCPPWIPADMVAFWGQAALAREGVRRG